MVRKKKLAGKERMYRSVNQSILAPQNNAREKEDGTTSMSVDEVALEACEGETPSSSAVSRKSSEPLSEAFPPLEAFLLQSNKGGPTLEAVQSCFRQ